MNLLCERHNLLASGTCSTINNYMLDEVGASSETQGQFLGEGKSLNGREKNSGEAVKGRLHRAFSPISA